MSGNSAFELVSERGWRRGLDNMLRSEMSHWWKTRLWWIQCLIWVGIIGFMLSAILFSGENPPAEEVSMIYSIFSGLFPSVGVVIIMQDALVGEKKDGTAAWVLSKPVSRAAFVLSKVFANSLGVLVTMIFLPGLAAFILVTAVRGSIWSPFSMLGALGVIFVSLFFFLSLTLMLGTFFNSRGPVIGIALALLFMQQYLVGLAPFLRYFLPWSLSIPGNGGMDAVVPNILLGMPVFSLLPVLFVALEGIAFILIALYRFNREEF